MKQSRTFTLCRWQSDEFLRHVPDMKSEFFNQRPEIKPEDRKVGYIVVTADKGLAGSYNHNIFKDVEECLKSNSHAKLFGSR